ncbi:dihydrolipoyl dehydrogenase family protein [Muricoccus pecuniae]|uniref:Pyruvate/2-oxoglutarate dehydrogenase complex dihydrolipoamide dehydrogenase (E3) component n=1 Tax=Muricoccus pecuniae TaxID=693023 RepID=A0A840Y5A5_9PROT|nr:FAD-dependent oxidoreductase [Roseomonas pecuniae]MBB5695326.1 pyruvate/2-oxoglutarate dehydrogenase complex dihydrolipoamide dehydrogenase (E3) component [Roseomonas pecuniae]
MWAGRRIRPYCFPQHRAGRAALARTHDLIVIGAGAAGLTAAGGCARLGLRVALVERDRMGGECLNTGCVPSKALLAAAHRAQAVREGGRLGILAGEPTVDFGRVRAHVRAAIDAIAPHDSEERFRAWGVEVIRGEARLLDARGRVEVGGRVLEAPRIVLATGSRPAIPAVEGLAGVPFLTNETLWDLDRLPEHLVVLGGGPAGMEMAQAFRRLGAAVTVIASGRPFPRDDPEAAALVLDRLGAEGVTIRPETRATRVTRTGAGLRVETDGGWAVEGSHLLVAAGRRAAVEGLGLEAAGVTVDPGGIRVDARRRTTNPRILAIGDCRDGPRFTHAAGHEGTVAVMNIGLGIPAGVKDAALPWVTFTDPELAQLGLTEAAARERHGHVEVHREDFAENDRAVAEGDTAGFVKVIKARGRVVGATIVGAGAGEMVLPWSLAIAGKASPWAISGAVVPYPTHSELSKAVAFAGCEPRIFGPWARRWAGVVARLRR